MSQETRPTKAQRKEAARLERERIQQEMVRRGRMRKVWIALGVVAVLGIGALLVFVPTAGDEVSQEPDGVQRFEFPTRNHVEGAVPYEQTPPAGGDHAPEWLNCGAYAEPIPSENAVHSMEHGAAWITYRPDLPADQVASMNDLARDDFIIVSPFPDLPAPIVATAWGRQLQLQEVDDDALAQFLRSFRLGPNTPELGAPCSGGIGTPT